MLAVVAAASLSASCFYNRQPCFGQTPCWVELTPAQLEALNYRHIVVIADVQNYPTSLGPGSLDGQIHTFRASLAAGLSADSLQALHPVTAILFDSTYHQTHDLSGREWGDRNEPFPDSSWHLRWPEADAVLEIRQVFPKLPCSSREDCERTNTTCCLLLMYLWDLRTDSAVWIEAEDLADISIPKGQRLLGAWIGPATVRLLQEARAIQ